MGHGLLTHGTFVDLSIPTLISLQEEDLNLPPPPPTTTTCPYRSSTFYGVNISMVKVVNATGVRFTIIPRGPGHVCPAHIAGDGPPGNIQVLEVGCFLC